MNVQFESPETAFDINGNKIWKNGFKPTNPSDFDKIPNTPGVYVIGVKVNNIFYPCYIGETGSGKGSLRSRLSKHYGERSKINSNSTKEIFDLSNISSNFKNYYRAIEEYNNLWIFNSNFKGSRQKHNLYINKHIDDYLIYFQCKSYLNYKLNLNVNSSCWIDINHKDFHTDLLFLKNKSSTILNSYLNTKKCFEDNFFFIYTTLSNSNLQQRRNIEAEVKFKFQNNLKIFTSSDVTGSGKSYWKKIITSPILNIYDFSCIQNDLINLTGKPVINPLIL
jgi:hypothetical protein